MRANRSWLSSWLVRRRDAVHLEPRAAPLVRHFHVDAGSVGAGIPRAKEQGHLTAEHDPIGAHLTERPDEEPPPRWPLDRLRCRHSAPKDCQVPYLFRKGAILRSKG